MTVETRSPSNGPVAAGAEEPRAQARSRRGPGGLAVDLIELLELQAALLLHDADQAKRRAALPTTLVVSGVVLALASLPILLVAVAFAMKELGGMSTWAAFGVTFVVSAVLAAATLLLGVQRMEDVRGSFCESREEWSSNVRFLRETLSPEAGRADSDQGVSP